ncbi:yabby protein [Mucor lusitanicus]|uniref:Yabby protein n=2 Tax=Mucor circinelloides f. lusitanicus TaxID=29924 RepID=A0A168P290_MUCCL|nr:yabby protein [Mucor lusitanicus]OAD07056.1 yabby protein [Mucor lusitanicus CBS 277.49]
MAKDKIAKKGPRKVSAYNSFIKTEIAKVKKDNPDMAHKDVFKKAASNWSHSPENPKSSKK